MAKSGNILLVRLKSFGDIVFALPAVQAVRAAFPSARLSFLVSKEYASLLKGFREVDEIIALDRRRLRGFKPHAMVGEIGALLWALRQRRFSLAVDFQGYGETALLTRFTGAPQRWGSVYRPGRQWAYTLGVPRRDTLHPAEHNLALLRAGGLPAGPVSNQFMLPESALKEARNFFSGQRLDPQRRTLFIQPFTSNADKTWPLDSFIALARQWTSQGWQVLFGGGPADQASLEPARAAGFSISAGCSLLLSAGLAQSSTLLVGGDTGLLHLATAMGKRVVMLMNSRNPGTAYPFQHPAWTVVPPASNPLLSAITVQAVSEACREALADPGAIVPAGLEAAGSAAAGPR